MKNVWQLLVGFVLLCALTSVASAAEWQWLVPMGKGRAFLWIPPRAKFPVKVTVVAWQHGRSSEPKLKDAAPVTREFSIKLAR
jgi:hypothetical protein